MDTQPKSPVLDATEKIFNLADAMPHHPSDICSALVWAASDLVQNNRAMSKDTFMLCVSRTWDEVLALKSKRTPQT